MDLANQYLLGILIISLSSCIDTTVLIKSIRQLCLGNIDIIIHENCKKLTLITMLSYTLCSMGDLFQILYIYSAGLESNDWSAFQSHIAGGKDIIYYTGNIAFFLLLLTRIKTSFQVSKCIMIYLFIILLISAIFSGIWCCIYFIKLSPSKQFSYTVMTSYPLSIIDFILNLSLFIIFIYKIKHKDSMEGFDIDTISGDDIESCFNQSGKKAVWNVMIKHCVLFGIALISNQSWYIANIITISKPLSSEISTNEMLIITFTIRAIENMINIVILWLILRVNNNKYICLCKCWHKCILKYCMKEDPNSMNEGFIINERRISRSSITESMIGSNYKIEGHDLIVTNNRDRCICDDSVYHSKAKSCGRVEGNSLLQTI